MIDEDEVEKLVSAISEKIHLFETFQSGVETFFRKNPKLNNSPPVIHSIKGRIKDFDHLRGKIRRKSSEGNSITVDTLFDKITDIAGVRVLHLHEEQFTQIHESIHEQLTRKDWVLHEPPKAYTWDPESTNFFKSKGLEVSVKESFYTSIHYVVKPRQDSEVCCEIQIRTLFEEIWGEIEHTINYPVQTTNLACKEQLRVLARLVGAGSRLADSIFRTWEDKT
jgi:putative GTP pyrophosphokinase